MFMLLFINFAIDVWLNNSVYFFFFFIYKFEFCGVFKCKLVLIITLIQIPFFVINLFGFLWKLYREKD